ncbi:MAG TPA: O-antigen ligase family protein [Chthoniobacteraceae bacterium]|jgi:hypothetical protein|nr:O-antigen ligase family protein [Chthoniobacteraceae bacterium]
MLLYLAPFYAALYWILGYRNPRIPLMLIFATAPLQNDMSGGGPLRFSIAEINMLLAVPLLILCKRRPISLGPLTGGIGFYLLVSLGCTLLHWRYTSLICLVQMVLYLGVAVLIFYALPRSEYDYQFAMDGLMWMSVALAATVLVRRTGFVWNLHKNGVGESLAASLIVCAEMWFAAQGKRKRILSAAFIIIAAGLFFTLSRGAWLGALVGISVLIALRRQFRLLFRLSIVLVPLLAICWSHLPAASKDYATGFSSADNYNIKLRYESVDYAESLFHLSPWIGNGVGLRKEYDATNIVWCTLAETGVAGLFSFFVLHWVIIRFTWKTQKNINRSTTLYSGIALGGALVLSRLLHGMVDHYWGRGSNTVVWSAVGMALYGYHAKRRSILLARREAALAAVQAEAASMPIAEIAPPVLAY